MSTRSVRLVETKLSQKMHESCTGRGYVHVARRRVRDGHATATHERVHVCHDVGTHPSRSHEKMQRLRNRRRMFDMLRADRPERDAASDRAHKVRVGHWQHRRSYRHATRQRWYRGAADARRSAIELSRRRRRYEHRLRAPLLRRGHMRWLRSRLGDVVPHRVGATSQKQKHVEQADTSLRVLQ